MKTTTIATTTIAIAMQADFHTAIDDFQPETPTGKTPERLAGSSRWLVLAFM
jgi:hypothetical protein